jgi:predicted lipoprotein
MKNRYAIILLLALITALIACAKDKSKKVEESTQQSFELAKMMQNLYDNLVLVEYNSFRKESVLLATLCEELSTNTSSEYLGLVQQQWRIVFEAWKNCELYNIGEVKRNFLQSNIGKWPADTLRMVNYINGTDTINESFIKGLGANTRSLYALEYLLFNLLENEANDLAKTQQRKYAIYLTEVLKQESFRVLEFANDDAYWFYSSLDNSVSSAVSQIFNTQIALLEQVLNDKLANPLGKHTGVQAPKKVETPFARVSLLGLQQNILSLQNCFTGRSGLGFDDWIETVQLPHDSEGLTKKVNEKYATVLAKIEMIDNNSINLISSTPQLEELYFEIKGLLTIYKSEIASALSITLSFNDNDGD